jgi:HK97 gp10 family phage protein
MAGADRPRRIYFNTGRIIKRAQKATAKALDKVAKEMTQDIRRKISKPYPPASRPGAHPHMRRPTVGLRSQTKVERKGKKMWVKTPQYGIYLEGGTRKMKARPFIRRNIHDKMSTRWTRRINTLIRKYSGSGVPYYGGTFRNNRQRYEHDS